MKSLNDKLATVKNVLLTITDNVGMYEAINSGKTYIVYYPESEASELAADNVKSLESMSITVDLYAREKDGGVSIAEQIKQALNNANISHYLSAVIYESETGFVHYEFVCEVG